MSVLYTIAVLGDCGVAAGTAEWQKCASVVRALQPDRVVINGDTYPVLDSTTVNTYNNLTRAPGSGITGSPISKSIIEWTPGNHDNGDGSAGQPDLNAAFGWLPAGSGMNDSTNGLSDTLTPYKGEFPGSLIYNTDRFRDYPSPGAAGAWRFFFLNDGAIVGTHTKNSWPDVYGNTNNPSEAQVTAGSTWQAQRVKWLRANWLPGRRNVICIHHNYWAPAGSHGDIIGTASNKYLLYEMLGLHDSSGWHAELYLHGHSHVCMIQKKRDPTTNAIVSPAGTPGVRAIDARSAPIDTTLFAGQTGFLQMVGATAGVAVVTIETSPDQIRVALIDVNGAAMANLASSGLSGSNETIILPDASGPGLLLIGAITSPAQGAQIQGTTATVTWPAATGGTAPYTYQIDRGTGSFVTPSSGGSGLTDTYTSYAAGSHTVTVKATDSLGQTATAQRTFSTTISLSWTDIAGATGRTYQPVSGDIGKVLRVVVTETNRAGVATAASAATAPVQDVGPGQPPSFASTPTLSPSTNAPAGTLVTCDSGGVTGADTITYRWQRLTSPFNGVPTTIKGPGSDNTYTRVSADVGAEIRCLVVATNVNGQSSASTAWSDPGGVPVNVIPPSLSDSTPQVGDVLLCDKGAWTGDTLGETYQWMTSGGALDAILHTFQGSASSGWTAADTGQAMVITQGTATQFNQTPGLATIQQVAGNAPIIGTTDINEGDYDETVTFKRSSMATGAKQNFTVGLRYIDAANYTRVRVDEVPGGHAVVGGDRQIANVNTALATDVNTGAAITDNTLYNLRVQAIGTTVRAKLWLASAVEPVSWTWSGTDAQALVTGGICVRTQAVAGNTNLALYTITNITGSVPGGGGGSPAPIPGATSASYTVQSGDLGVQLACTVTARNATGTTVLQTPFSTAVTAAGGGTPPVATTPPTIPGNLNTPTLYRGTVVTSVAAVWTGASSVTRKWQRNTGGGWTDISGATSLTYTVKTTGADDGAQLRVVETATGAGGTASSAATSVGPVYGARITAWDNMVYDAPLPAGHVTELVQIILVDLPAPVPSRVMAQGDGLDWVTLSHIGGTTWQGPVALDPAVAAGSHKVRIEPVP